MQGLPRNRNVPALVGTIFVLAMETSEDGESYRFHDFNRYLSKDSILAAADLWMKACLVDRYYSSRIERNAARSADPLKGINVAEYNKRKKELREQLDALERND